MSAFELGGGRGAHGIRNRATAIRSKRLANTSRNDVNKPPEAIAGKSLLAKPTAEMKGADNDSITEGEVTLYYLRDGAEHERKSRFGTATMTGYLIGKSTAKAGVTYPAIWVGNLPVIIVGADPDCEYACEEPEGARACCGLSPHNIAAVAEDENQQWNETDVTETFPMESFGGFGPIPYGGFDIRDEQWSAEFMAWGGVSGQNCSVLAINTTNPDPQLQYSVQLYWAADTRQYIWGVPGNAIGASAITDQPFGTFRIDDLASPQGYYIQFTTYMGMCPGDPWPVNETLGARFIRNNREWFEHCNCLDSLRRVFRRWEQSPPTDSQILNTAKTIHNKNPDVPIGDIVQTLSNHFTQ